MVSGEVKVDYQADGGYSVDGVPVINDKKKKVEEWYQNGKIGLVIIVDSGWGTRLLII